MVLSVLLFQIALDHLLHDHIGINVHLLAQLVVDDPPLSGDSQSANRRFSINKSVNAVGCFGEGEGVCSLANGLLVCDLVDTWFTHGGITGLKVMRDHLGASHLDVCLMIMKYRKERIPRDVHWESGVDRSGWCHDVLLTMRYSEADKGLIDAKVFSRK
jgi:hypothetical protein